MNKVMLFGLEYGFLLFLVYFVSVKVKKRFFPDDDENEDFDGIEESPENRNE